MKCRAGSAGGTSWVFVCIRDSGMFQRRRVLDAKGVGNIWLQQGKAWACVLDKGWAATMSGGRFVGPVPRFSSHPHASTPLTPHQYELHIHQSAPMRSAIPDPLPCNWGCCCRRTRHPCLRRLHMGRRSWWGCCCVRGLPLVRFPW
jgi:hypothetical protein